MQSVLFVFSEDEEPCCGVVPTGYRTEEGVQACQPIREEVSPWDSHQISRFESLKKGPKIVAILITFIVWRARKSR